MGVLPLINDATPGDSPLLTGHSIQRSAWKGNSANFALTEFSEVRHGPGPLPIGSYCAAQPGYEPAGCLTVTVRRFQKLIRAISMIKAERVGSS
jgi:hypothetical protein